ncbi:MAG: hypothetical protein NTU53_09875 [Planctomycetota bacterium]|nr:hypothetical protein [Planctomycetota bacterium]
MLSMRTIVVVLPLLLLIATQGCGPSQMNTPSFSSIESIAPRLGNIKPGMTEQQALSELGLDAYRQYMGLHSMGGGSFWFDRMYSFPQHPQYSLRVLTNASNRVANVTFTRERDVLSWQSKQDAP